MTAIGTPLLLRTSAESAQHLADLERVWRRPAGLYGWLTTTDHEEIGLRFVKIAFIFFCLAGVLALLMRIQLSTSRSRFLGPDVHPDVDNIFLPATGFVSSIVVTCAGRKMFAYMSMVLARIATAFIGCGVWVHHMFASPLPELG